MQEIFTPQRSIGPDACPQFQQWGSEGTNRAFGYTDYTRHRYSHTKSHFQDIAALDKFGLDPRSKSTTGIITQATGYGFPIDGYTTGYTVKLPPPAYPSIASQIPRSGLNPRIVGVSQDEIGEQGTTNTQEYSIGNQQTNVGGELIDSLGNVRMDAEGDAMLPDGSSDLFRRRSNIGGYNPLYNPATAGQGGGGPVGGTTPAVPNASSMSRVTGKWRSGFGGVGMIQSQGAAVEGGVDFTRGRAIDDAINVRLQSAAMRAIHTTTAGRQKGSGGLGGVSFKYKPTATGVASSQDYSMSMMQQKGRK